MFRAAKESLIQAYPNAPWRNQVQVIGIFAVGLVSIAMLAGLYLTISVQAATLGREIQDMQLDILDVQRNNANLETRLAELSSAAVVENRAIEMGFVSADEGSRQYLPVPGYVARREIILAPPPTLVVPAGSEYPAALNQTLFEWLQEAAKDANFEGPQSGSLPEAAESNPSAP